MSFDVYVANGLHEYLGMMQPIIPIFHLAYVILCNRLLFFGNSFRASFEWFVTLHYTMFLFFPFGWLWVQLGKEGPALFSNIIRSGIPLWFPGESFGLSGFHFMLTIFLLVLWFFEARSPKNDFDLRKVRWWNYWVVPLMIWGFVYPFYQMETPGRFAFLGFSALWRSPFGVLMNPTSTFLLGLLTLIYPRVNFRLFYGKSIALLIIALIVVRSSPLEWPMAILAIYNLVLGLVYLAKKRIKGVGSQSLEVR